MAYFQFSLFFLLVNAKAMSLRSGALCLRSSRSMASINSLQISSAKSMNLAEEWLNKSANRNKRYLYGLDYQVIKFIF